MRLTGYAVSVAELLRKMKMMNLNLNTVLFLTLVAAFTAGTALGAFYFTALWHTVRQLPTAKSPARLMIGSFIIRMVVVLIGFYLVMGEGHWERLAAAMHLLGIDISMLSEEAGHA